MALIKSVNGVKPIISKKSFIAENATIVGDVTILEGSSIWYSVVIRGDVNSIKIGKNTNIQDGVVVHCTHNGNSTIIEDDVTIGHNAIIHGCTIRSNVLIGMGAVILDNVEVKSGSIVAAGAVVLENTVIEMNTLYAGVPAALPSALR